LRSARAKVRLRWGLACFEIAERLEGHDLQAERRHDAGDVRGVPLNDNRSLEDLDR
jgi:hypothetical protein